MFTQRHYIAMAAILNAEWTCAGSSADVRLSVRRVAFRMADMFDKDSERFKRDVFYQAVFGSEGPAIP